jgi:hypothetical protein
MRNDKEFIELLKELHLKGELNHDLMRAIHWIKWNKSRKNKINWTYDFKLSRSENKILIRQQKTREILRLHEGYIPFSNIGS